MNCAEWERLSDAYLDGQLAGSLRLEFDAHRLRCRRCQQTLTMMEAVEHVIAADTRMPAISDDFTARVMSGIKGKQPTPARRRNLRIALAVGGLLQAAAVIVMAFYLVPWHKPAEQPRDINSIPPGELNLAGMDPVDLTEYIFARVDAKVAAARSNLASDLGQLAQYPLNITVSPEMARASSDLATMNPFTGLLHALTPVITSGEESGSSEPDHDSL